MVLPQVQPYADDSGFGDEWRKMCDERTVAASTKAAKAAKAAIAARASYAADRASYAAARASYAVYASYDAAIAANAAARASYDASIIGRNDFWQEVDPIGVLERMIEV